ncbi:MAG: hypothetical protein IJE88_07350 [Akkermansia sp.]|nr:hypothetical protein [Akkermansia sp.]
MPDKTWFATFLVGMVIELPTAALWAGYAFLGNDIRTCVADDIHAPHGQYSGLAA